MIERLIEAAKDKRPAARRALSMAIIDLCHEPGSRISPEDKALAGEILVHLVRDLELQLRAQISQKLANSPHAPYPLIRALAEDEISVAAPVIAQSPLLSDMDLIEIVTSKTREHRLLVAARPGIPAAVGDALLKPGEPEVLAALLNNQTADISQAAMEYAIEESRHRENLRALLITRSDLPPRLAQKLLAFVSDEMKRQLAAKFPQDREIICQAMSEISAARNSTVSGPSQGVGIKAAALIERLHANGELNITRVISFLRERRLPLFFAGMAALTRLNTQSLVHFAFESEAQGLAVICRAAGADRGQFVSVVLLLEHARSGRPLPPAQLQSICRLFDSLSETRAHEVLEDWRTKLHSPEKAVNVA